MSQATEVPETRVIDDAPPLIVGVRFSPVGKIYHFSAHDYPDLREGDFVVVTNARKVRLTGKKPMTKQYDYYTYHSGGHKYVSVAEMMEKKPEKIIIEAVRRMLPKNKLARKMLSKLKVYRGSEHPHAAQMPQVLES